MDGSSAAYSGLLFCIDAIIAVRDSPQVARTCCNMLKRVVEDTAHANYLQQKLGKALIESSREVKWMNSVISDATKTFLELQPLLSKMRPAMEGKKFALKNRLSWTTSDDASFQAKTKLINAQHLTILTIISQLQSLIIESRLKRLIGELSHKLENHSLTLNTNANSAEI